MYVANQSTGRHRLSRRLDEAPQRKVSSYAACVGRVGALALALGVGAAVTGLGGTAWADNTSGAGDDKPGGTTSETNDNDSSADDNESGDADAPDDTRPSGRPQWGDGPGARLVEGLVRATTDLLTGARPGDADDTESNDDDALDPSDDDESSSDDPVVPESTENQPLSGQGYTFEPQTFSAPEPVAAPPQPQPAITQVTQRVVEDVQSLVRVAIPSNTLSSNNFESAQLRTADTSPAPVAPLVATESPVVQFVGGILTALGFSTTATNNTPAVPGIPLVFAALELIRREIEHTFFRPSPVVEDQQITLDEGTSQSIILPGRNADGDALTYTVTQQPTSGSVSAPVLNDDGDYVVTYTAGADTAPGTDSFVVTASDADSTFHFHGLLGLFSFGAAHTDTATVNVTIEDTGDAPEIVSVTPVGNIDPTTGARTYAVKATDDTTLPEALVVTVSDPVDFGGNAAGATISAPTYNEADQTWEFTYTPNQQARVDAYSTAAVEEDHFTVTVEDAAGEQDTADIDVIVPVAAAAVTATIIVGEPGDQVLNTYVNPNNGHLYATVIRQAYVEPDPEDPEDPNEGTVLSVLVYDTADNTLVGEAYTLPASNLNDNGYLYLSLFSDPVVDADGNVYMPDLSSGFDGMHSGRIAVIHADGSDTTYIPVDGLPVDFAVSPDGESVYAKVASTNSAQFTVVKVDAEAGTATPITPPLSGGSSVGQTFGLLGGLSVGSDGRVYTSGAVNVVYVVDEETGNTTDEIESATSVILIVDPSTGDYELVEIDGLVTDVFASDDGEHIYVKRADAESVNPSGLYSQSGQLIEVESDADPIELGPTFAVPIYGITSYVGEPVSNADGSHVAIQDVAQNESQIVLKIVDVETGTVTELPISQALDLSYGSDRIYVANGTRTIRVISVADQPETIV